MVEGLDEDESQSNLDIGAEDVEVKDVAQSIYSEWWPLNLDSMIPYGYSFLFFLKYVIFLWTLCLFF